MPLETCAERNLSNYARYARRHCFVARRPCSAPGASLRRSTQRGAKARRLVGFDLFKEVAEHQVGSSAGVQGLAHKPGAVLFTRSGGPAPVGLAVALAANHPLLCRLSMVDISVV